MLRLFIGIPLPDTHQKLTQTIAAKADEGLRSRVRWTRPGNAHLTLKFLGNVEENTVDGLVTALSAIEFPAFPVELGPCDGYPNIRKPRVIWKGLRQGAKECTTLADMIENAAVALDFKPSAKPFTPHLTLGRVKKDAHDQWQIVLHAADTKPWPGFRADRFVLWKSDLTPDGPIYTELSDFLLTD